MPTNKPVRLTQLTSGSPSFSVSRATSLPTSEAAAAFDSAMVCYEDRINMTLGQLDRVKASTKGTAAFRARRIVALETELADRRKRYYASAFNAASMTAKIGNLTRAAELLAIADGGEDLAEQIAKLRAEIQRVTAEQAASTNAKRPPPKKAAVADSLNKPSSRR